MKRRDFLKTPALSVLIPGSLSSGALAAVTDAPAGSAMPGEPASGPDQMLQKMHPDFMTYLEGIEYFVLGNGEVIGAVQFAPKDSPASFFGFTLWDAEVFCRKWSSYLYHPERGFANTRVGVLVGEPAPGEEAKTGMFTGVKGYALSPETFQSVAREYPDGIPTVAVRWKAGSCDIEERFWVPNRGAVVYRAVTVRNRSEGPLEVGLTASLYANFGLFDRISTDPKAVAAVARGLASMELRCLEKPATAHGRYEVRANLGILQPGASARATYVYSVGSRGTPPAKIAAGSDGLEKTRKETAKYWSARSEFSTGNPLLDGMFGASMAGMRAVVARSGRMDASPWMYNMEWVSDHALAVEALLHCGMTAEARTMLERAIAESVGDDGRTIESSRWFGFDYTELNQNGMLLWGTWVYACWTGDLALIKKHWKKIALCADFPLQSVFFDAKARMVHNKREFWERSDTHGVEDGFELAYQFWVSHGLAKAAELAALVGDAAAKTRWQKASHAIRESALRDPVYRLIEENRLIKRRKRSGEWHRHFIPPDRTKLPAGSPIATLEKPTADPDTITTYPIIFGMVDPRGDLAARTLDWMEEIWNQNWTEGGYPRYNTTGEDNPPASWPLASLLVARANAEAGNDARVWKVLRWLEAMNPLKSWSWFERYGQSITPPMPPVSFINWVWYEILSLELRHMAGFRPELDRITIRPWLPAGVERCDARVTVRGRPLTLSVTHAAGPARARVNGLEQPMTDGTISIPYAASGETRVLITLPNKGAE